MKNKLAGLCAVILVFLFLGSACSKVDTFDPTWSTDPSGNRVMQTTGDTTIFPKKLPLELTYNDSYISVTDVQAYQTYSSYQYTLFMVVEIDVSSLSDSELHWLRESDIDVNAYLTSDKNGQDFDNMPELGSLLLTDKDTIQFVLMSSPFDENRYDFAGSEVSVCINITQEETYVYTDGNGKQHNNNCSIGMHYTFTLPDDIKDGETIPNPLYGYVVDWMGKWGDSYLP